jgi:ABC-2 type transport system permease protein
MKNILLLLRRQFLAYFRTPLGFTVIIVFLIVSGFSFCRLISQSAVEPVQVGDILFGSAYFWLIFLVTIALITMPLLAEERRSGTLENLLTAPVTDLQVASAKFLAGFAFIIVMLAPTLVYSAIIYMFQAPDGPFAFRIVLSGYLIVLLIGGFYIAFGLLMSSLTGSMVIAAILCCAGMSVTFLAENLQYALSNARLEEVLARISSIQHIIDFSRGIIDSQAIVFYLSGMVLFIYLTVKSLESRLWR